MAHKDPQLGLRLPSDLKNRIKKLADAERRSMNGQIIVLVEQALRAADVSHEKAA